jgi:hypothetical protein
MATSDKIPEEDYPELSDPGIDTDSQHYDPSVDGAYTANGGDK